MCESITPQLVKLFSKITKFASSYKAAGINYNQHDEHESHA
jgi:hypothetical protein